MKMHLPVMACHKYASNIVEKAIQQIDEEGKQDLVDIVLQEPGTGDLPLLTMMKDKFGNYVVQKLMQIAQGERKVKLEQSLNQFIPVLEKLPYGKHILYALKDEWEKQRAEMEEEGAEGEEAEAEAEPEADGTAEVA